MDQERMTILRLLEEKKITAEEAADLLRALEAPAAKRSGAEGAPRYFFGFQHDSERIEEAARNAERVGRRAEQIAERVPEMIERMVGRLEFGGLPFFGPSFRFDETVEGDLAEGLENARLAVETGNGRVSVRCTDEARRVRAVLHKTVRGSSEGDARERARAFGSARIEGDEVVVAGGGGGSWLGSWSLAVDLYLPRALAWGGSVRTSNGRIDLDGVRYRGLELNTSNGRIQLSDCTGADLAARTSNGRIEAARVGGRGRLQTSNGRIECRLDPAEGDNTVELTTSNGSIRVDGPAHDVGWQLDADTSGGRIHADLPGISVNQGRHGWPRAHASGTTPDYGEKPRRIRCEAHTNNGSISIAAV